MLKRWLTSRMWRSDASSLGRVAPGVGKFLGVQDDRPSGGDAMSGMSRVGTLTYHFGRGRGAQWSEPKRDMLWLASLSDRHDPGYILVRDLDKRGELYPETDPDWKPAEGTLAPWGAFHDEDAYEWARTIYGALCTFQIHYAALLRGESVGYGSADHVTLQLDSEGPSGNRMWKLTIRRRLGYLPPLSRRGRTLTNDELHRLFMHLAGHPGDDDYVVGFPPIRWPGIFVDYLFVGEPEAPERWLNRMSDWAVNGRPDPAGGYTPFM